MPTSPRYGRVRLERTPEGMAEDEPVFLLRAADKLAPAEARAYAARCDAAGCGAAHVRAAEEAADAMERWQGANPGRVKLPDTG